MMSGPVKVSTTTVRPPTTLTDGLSPTAGPPASGVSANAPAPRVTTSLNVTVRLVTIDRCAAPPLTTTDCTAGGGATPRVAARVAVPPSPSLTVGCYP